MARYRNDLPQLADRPFLTDGGLETVLVFHEGRDLPAFAAFGLLDDEDGRRSLRRYYAPYLETARAHRAGFILESPTWRASSAWGPATGRSAAQIDEANRAAIALCDGIRKDAATPDAPVVISGCIGPRGDGYAPGDLTGPEEAQQYHARQIEVFEATAADMVTAITMTNAPEAVGIARAAREVALPVVISFTVETDGTLPTGQGLGDAIEEVDAATDAAPAYYMINCAHPTHFRETLAAGGDWRRRIRGVRPNASRCSHAELDEAPELDEGNPTELGAQVRELRGFLPGLNVFGGCCGTDHRHVAAIAEAALGPRARGEGNR